ncbi:MAG: hypothetical protein R3E48_03585 [Burkholderiaceae bacterium]
MSFGIDVNILLYASDQSNPLHPKAASFLESCASGKRVFCIAWLTAMSYLRMATHGSIFSRPLSADEACANLDALFTAALPRARQEDGFWNVYRK